MDKKSIIMIAAAGMLGLLVGSAIPMWHYNNLLGPQGERETRSLKSTYSIFAKTDGTLREPEESFAYVKTRLALDTISVGQSFDSIKNPKSQDDVLRILKAIDKNASLRLENSSSIGGWAELTRRCVLSNVQKGGSAVSACSHEAAKKHGLATNESQTATLAAINR